jgi:hypothetical protein
MKRRSYHTTNQFGKDLYDILGKASLMIAKMLVTVGQRWKLHGFGGEFYTSYNRNTPELIEHQQNQGIH